MLSDQTGLNFTDVEGFDRKIWKRSPDSLDELASHPNS